MDVGICGSEEMYYATMHHNLCGGMIVTGSHNPLDYNGIKVVREQATPVSIESGLQEISDYVEKHLGEEKPVITNWGKFSNGDIKPEYIKHLNKYFNDSLKPLKIVVNAGNGPAGRIIDMLEKTLPFEFIKINHEKNPTFPNGIPNPLLPENRKQTADAVKANNADMGIAWDGDFDRCFLFDEKGEYISTYYLLGMLSEFFLKKHNGAKVVYDPRLNWSTLESIKKLGGSAVISKAGHSFIKQKMNEEDAVFGGEVSGHFFFKSFGYCDSGMIPWIIVVSHMCETGQTLSEIIGERYQEFPSCDERNLTLSSSAKSIMDKVEDYYKEQAETISHLDGLSVEFSDWRFNLRPSNTEPLVRLNVESRNNVELMQQKLSEVLSLIQ
jgi:phosphomannomutase